MDGSRTSSAGRLPPLGARGSVKFEPRFRGYARRREQLRLLSDPATRAGAAQFVSTEHPFADAFDMLHQRYAPYVSAIGLRLLGRVDELDDLVQDVFMQVLRALAELRDPVSFRGWLTQLTIRNAARRLRKRCFRREPSSWTCTRTAAPAKRTLSREVYMQLDVLPPQTRLIWVLRHIQGEALHVIAKRAGCSLSAVQRHLLDAEDILEDRFIHEYTV